MDRLGCRSSCAGQRAIQPPPALWPPRVLAIFSAIISGLVALIRFVGEFYLDSRELFYPSAQVAGEHKGAAATLDGSQLAGLDSLIESRPARVRDGTRLGNAVGKW